MTIDLNILIALLNISVCLTGVFSYLIIGDTQHINFFTILLLCILGTTNTVLLFYGKLKRDPFLIITIITTTLFYMTRVVSLLYFQDYFPWEISANLVTTDYNRTLIFIILGNWSIYFGLRQVQGNIPYRETSLSLSYRPKYVSVIIVILITYAIYFSNFLPAQSSIFLNILTITNRVIFNIEFILLSTILFMLLYYNDIPIKYSLIILLLLLLFIFLFTLLGSRGALVICFNCLLISFLSVKRSININIKYVLLSPLILPIAYVIFMYGSMFRAYIEKISVWSGQYEILQEVDYSSVVKSEKVLKTLFYRIGWLDFSADIFKGKDKYAKVINMTYLMKSIVDNALTPGFDIYDTARVSFLISHIRNDARNILSKTDLEKEYYNSDMLSIYGEYFVLFSGYASLIFLFFSGYLFKLAYIRINNENLFKFYLNRSLILFIYYYWLTSFGIDWLCLTMATFLINKLIFTRYYV